MEGTEDIVRYVVGTLLTAVIGGIGWLVKRYFDKRDEDKAEMKKDIAAAKADIKKTRRQFKRVVGMIIGCQHPDCPTKAALKQYWDNEDTDDND